MTEAVSQLAVTDVTGMSSAATPLASALAILHAATPAGAVVRAAVAPTEEAGAVAAAEGAGAVGASAEAAGAVAAASAAAAAAAGTGQAVPAAQAAPHESLVELLRNAVAEECRCENAPEVLVVVVIMRMDQLAAGRPFVGGVRGDLDTIVNPIKHYLMGGAGSSSSSGTGSSRSRE